jgi:Glycosyltransferase sugar-binding region containing DXD motif/Galactosyltransferase
MYWDRLPPQKIEDCRHRSPGAGNGSAVCELLVHAGVPRGQCDVSGDVCSACLRQFPPAPDCWNTVVASLIYARSLRALESASLRPQERACLTRTRDRASRHLTVGEPAFPDARAGPDGRVTTTRLREILPPPRPRGRRCVRVWAVGVVSAPRRQPTLEITLDSLARAGWDTPHLFLDGTVRVPGRFAHLPGVLREPRVGCWPNYHLALAELLMRRPDVDAYLLAEDDVRFFDAEVLREYLEQMLWPDRRSCLVSLYCSSACSAPDPGWRPWPQRWTWGSLAFVFPRHLAQEFVLDRAVCEHRWGRWSEEGGGLTGTDLVIGWWALRKRVPIWYPNPSLVQHLGETSTLGLNLRATGDRREGRWAGSLMASVPPSGDRPATSPPADAGPANPSCRLVIGVLTASPFHARRAAVMATWGHDAAAHAAIELVFLVGDPAARMPRREGRILYLPCPDDYNSLPQKVRWFCLWGLAHTRAPWFFKCDDDTYVRVDRLLRATEAGAWRQAVVGCRDGDGGHFHGGAGYLIARDAALSIAARLGSATGLEDWKARDAAAAGGMWFEHDPRFCFDKSRMPLPDNDQITCHYCSPVRMRLIHDSFPRAAGAGASIPPVLHHIWLGRRPIPVHLQRYRESWLRHHPAWERKLWTEDNLGPLTNQRQFDAARTPAQKSHVARYEILHREGGVYVDFDMECLRPLDGFLPGLTGFAAAEDDAAVGIAILGAAPGDAVLGRVIALLGTADLEGTDPPKESGSYFFTGHILADRTWRLFWWSRFYPVHYTGRGEGPVEQADAIHHWEASWRR